MDLKKILKTIKLRQEQISIILGVFILIVAAIFTIQYVKNLKKQSIDNSPASTQNLNQIHTVSKGETLWSIAQTYYQKGSEWKKIADANNITSPTKLEVGDKLSIPDTAPKETPTPSPQITKEAAATTSAITGANYTVVKGDNLWKIAVRAYGDGYKWVQIAKANQLVHPSVIHTGNVFTIPR